MNYLGLIQLGLLASVGFAFLTALISTIAYPLARQRLSAMSPALRSNVLLTWLIAPALIGVVLTTFTFLPSLLSLLGFSSDHCTIHDGHLHLCLFHPPLPMDNITIQVCLVVLLGIVPISIGKHIFKLLQTYKVQRSLMIASKPYVVQGVYVVDWDMPLALSIGIRHMKIFISSQLIQALSPKQLEIVLAHEQAHLNRKDSLRHFIAHTVSFFHFPWLRSNMLMDFDLATEQACDEAAVKKAGNRLNVADTILIVERLFSANRPPFMAMSISGSNIPSRVEALLVPPPTHKSLSKTHVVLALFGLLFFTLAMMGNLHHFTESVLQIVAG
ncbi:MAG: M56 family metallopeptidase [Ghiorsea sp.]